MTKTTAKILPGPTGVSYEDVVTAANTLVARGERASFRKVRESLGGTGSLTTIQKHLKQWKEGCQLVAVTDADLSPGLRRAILSEIAHEVAAARSDISAELDEAKDVQGLLGDELEKRTSEVEQLTGQVAELENSVATMAGAIEELRAGAAAAIERERVLTGRAEALTRDLARAEIVLEQMPAIKQAATDTQAQLEAERELRHKAERDAAVLAAKLAAAEGLAETLANPKSEGQKPR